MPSPPIWILVVDDEPDLCALTKEFLEMSKDMEVDTVASVREAMSALAMKHYDAIVSDYQMPGEDGILFLKLLRGKGDLIPFILFTGKGREDVVIEALNNGADSYMQKGGKPTPLYAELEHRIRETVRRYEADKAVEQSNLELRRANEELAAAEEELAMQLEEIRAGNEGMAVAEEELRESEVRHRSLFENMINGAAIHEILCDANGVPNDYRFLELNSAFEKMTGLSRKAVVGRTVRDVLHQIEPIWVERYGRVALTGVPDHFESYSEALGKHYEVSVFRNATRQFTVIITDVTERKHAGEDLKKSEIKLRAVLDATPFPVAIVDLQDDIIDFWSNSARTLFGHTASTTEGWFEMAYPDPKYRQHVIDRWKPILEKARSSGQTVNTGEYQVACHDGSVLICELYATFLSDNLIVTFNNITERKRLEEALRESEGRFHTYFDNAPDGVFIVDETGRYLEVNPSACMITGYEMGELLGMHIPDLLPPESLEAGAKSFQEVIESGHSYNELIFRHKNGSLRHWSVDAVRLSPTRFIGFVKDITERKRAEKTVQENEEKFRQLFEMESDALFLIDKRDGKLLEANLSAEQMYGFSRSELVQMKNTDLSAQAEETTRTMMESATIIPVRLHRKKDGSIFPVEITATNFDRQGVPVLICAIRDITERRSAEQELGTAQAGLNEANRLAHIGTWDWNMENDVVTWSDELYEIAGRDPSLPAPTYAELPQHYSPTSWENLSGAVKAALTTGEPYNLELDMVRPNGSIRCTSGIGSVKLDEKGNVIGLHGMVQDITERKRAEGLLRETNEYLQNLLDHANAPIIVWNPDLIITTFNHAFERLTGMGSEQVIGKSLEILFPEETRSSSMAFIRQASVSELWNVVEIPIRGNDGSVRTVLWNSATLTAADGKVSATIAQGQDITERKRAENALQDANRKLGLLFSITQHDINNQLMALRGYLALLDEKRADASSDQHLLKAEIAAERISTMIEFTKAYEEIGIHAPIWQDARSLVRVASRDVRLEKVRLLNDVPAGMEIYADPLISKVFHNLMHNSMRHGSNIAAIRFYVEERDGVNIIICEDDGVGIPPDRKEKLFTQGFGKDHGLGLFLSREILAITGITITENGGAGKGARFVLTPPPGGLRTI